MASTYTTNLGIQKPGDGEQSGVWGDTVNLNSDIIDRAINGSVTLTLSGTSSTLTTSDGSLSNGQFKLLVLAGTLSATHTITISPDDAQKIYLVRNTTTQTVAFTQGSGGNASVAAGTTSIIYANGGGATAAVVNFTNILGLSSVTIANASISGSAITGGTVANAAITDGTVSGATISNATITGGSISGITDLAVADGGTGASTAADARTSLGFTGAVTSIATSNLTASRALASDGSGKVAVATTTATELGYVSGVTSAIQTQIDGKQAADSDLTAIAGLSSNGMIARTGSGTAAVRTVTAGTGIVVTNGSGVSGNPTVEADLASKSDAETGTNNTKLMTPLRVEEHTLANDLGWEQEWQNVTRTAATGYQNTTGRPIMAVFTIATNTSGSGRIINMEVSVNNSTWIVVGNVSVSDVLEPTSGSIIIPANHYYRWTWLTSSSSATVTVKELR